MNILSNVVKSTGKFLGNNIEKICKNTGGFLCENLQKNNYVTVGKGIKSSGRLLGKVGSITTKSIFNIASITLDGGVKISKFTGKALKEKAIKKEVRIYGKSKEFYKDKCVEAEYKILDNK